MKAKTRTTKSTTSRAHEPRSHQVQAHHTAPSTVRLCHELLDPLDPDTAYKASMQRISDLLNRESELAPRLALAICLGSILDRELFRCAGCDSFADFVSKRPFDRPGGKAYTYPSVHRLAQSGSAFLALKAKLGDFPVLPWALEQLDALREIDAAKRAEVWTKCVQGGDASGRAIRECGGLAPKRQTTNKGATVLEIIQHANNLLVGEHTSAEVRAIASRISELAGTLAPIPRHRDSGQTPAVVVADAEAGQTVHSVQTEASTPRTTPEKISESEIRGDSPSGESTRRWDCNRAELTLDVDTKLVYCRFPSDDPRKEILLKRRFLYESDSKRWRWPRTPIPLFGLSLGECVKFCENLRIELNASGPAGGSVK